MPADQDIAATTSLSSEISDLHRQLADAKRRLVLFLEASEAVGCWRWDIVNQQLTGDARFAAMTGQDALELAEGVPTNRFFSGIHSDDVARVRISVAGILAGAAVFSKEYRLLREDGAIRWIHAEGRSLQDDADQPVEFFGTLVDITNRRRTEDQLRIAQTAGQVGTFEHVVGSATVSVSHQFCRLLGLHPTNALPVRTIQFLVHPEDHPIIDWSLPPENTSGRTIESRITRADTGETRWLARRGEYVQDLEAKGLRYIGVIYDITDSKRIEERLRLANEALSESVRERTRERNQVWQNSRDLLTIVDANGSIRDANPAWNAILGLLPTDLIGRPFAEFAGEADRDKARKLVSLEGVGQETVEFDLGAADGSRRWFSWNATAEGDLIYAYGRHVTAERRQAKLLRETEDLLRQSQKMEAVGQLTGGIAHDFNNMLTGVIGSLHMMKRRIAARRYDELDRFMEAAVSSAERAAALIHRLLAFSRRQSLDRKPVDVVQLIRSMRDLLGRTLGEQISLETVLPSDCWHAVTDANQLESAVLNLVINARDAMPNGGRLVIEVANKTVSDQATAGTEDLASGDYVVVSVSDDGEGMAPEVIEKAFDPFFTTKPIGQGTGLGLSMIYGFARQSGGQVKISSALGRGTTVLVHLPRNTAPVQNDMPMRIAPTPRGRGETVVIVEDDTAVRLLVVAVLDELGYRTLEAADGNQALPILQSEMPVDLLISDVGLPGINGRQLAEIVRQTRPNLPVLFITGYAAMATSRSEFLAPGMDMIAKPFDVNDLANKIKGMLLGP